MEPSLERTVQRLLAASNSASSTRVPLADEGVQRTIPPSGNVQVSDGDALRTLAISGVGLVRLASFIVRDDIAANRLVPVLEEFNPGDIDELHAVYLGQGELLPIRIRVFLEFLAQQIKIGEAGPSRGA
jgi:DNA-binding transcriptional LysR family regulator